MESFYSLTGLNERAGSTIRDKLNGTGNLPWLGRWSNSKGFTHLDAALRVAGRSLRDNRCRYRYKTGCQWDLSLSQNLICGRLLAIASFAFDIQAPGCKISPLVRTALDAKRMTMI
jgi:hypothetical protein